LVVVFKVFVSEGHLQDEFVEGLDEIAVKKLLLEQSLAHKLADEIK
jgi:hypothetical protein